MTDIKSFVASLMYGEEHFPITEDEARYNLEQWKLEEWEDLPAMTPAQLTAEWNERARIIKRPFVPSEI